MSVHIIYKGNGGAKFMRPIHNREAYLTLRNSSEQMSHVSRIRQGEEQLKSSLVQMNYSCLPNADGSLKGSKTASMSVGMDIDFKAPCDLAEEEKANWLAACMAKVPELVLSKKDELGLLMLERSATKGYHLVFRRRPELSQEENLRWASELLGVAYDAQAKDITRVFFTTTGSEEDLIYLDDAIFEISAASGDTQGSGTSVTSQAPSQKCQPPCVTYDPEATYNGVLIKDIVAKYWELFNGGKPPVEGDRNALTFELAVTIRSICGYSMEKLLTVVPNYWAKPDGTCAQDDLAEWQKTIENALKEPRKGMPLRLKQVLQALKSRSLVRACH